MEKVTKIEIYSTCFGKNPYAESSWGVTKSICMNFEKNLGVKVQIRPIFGLKHRTLTSTILQNIKK